MCLGDIEGISAANLDGFDCFQRIRVKLTGGIPVNAVNRVSEDKLAGYFHVHVSCRFQLITFVCKAIHDGDERHVSKHRFY